MKSLESLTAIRKALQTEFADAVADITNTTPPPKPLKKNPKMREEYKEAGAAIQLVTT